MKTTWASLSEYVDGTSIKILQATNQVQCPEVDIEDCRRALAYRHMRRVHSKDGQPYCLIDIYLEQAVYDRRPDDFNKNTVLPVINSMPEVSIKRAKQVLTIGTAGIESAYHLGIPLNSPVANVVRMVQNTEDIIVYYSEITYRGDFVKLDIELL
jgi:GntR family transcriptional regulator